MDQNVLDRAVNTATRAALNGHPVSRIVWIPPQTATQHPLGSFVITYADHSMSATETAPWDKS
jgi:hypothetical protein